MAKKTHIKVRMVPESNPDSKFIYYAKKPTKGEKAKEVVLQYLLDNEPSFKVEYTKYNNVKAHYYDISDSIITLLGSESTNRESRSSGKI